MFGAVHVIFRFGFIFPVDLYRIVIVSRVVITCSSLVNFLLVCVITPRYVIVFVLSCHLINRKLIYGNCNSLLTYTATDEGHGLIILRGRAGCEMIYNQRGA